MAKPNKRTFIQRIIDLLRGRVLIRTIPQLKTELEVVKQKVIQEFTSDQISAEIAAGPSQSSNYLPYGSLFGFFGFLEGSTPISDLEKFLEKTIIVTDVRKNKTGVRVRTVFPSEEDFEDHPAFQLDWDGESPGSWPVRVERGLTGFPRFNPLMDPPPAASRSKGGIQMKKSRRGVSYRFRGLPYISRYNQLFRELEKDVLSRVRIRGFGR